MLKYLESFLLKDSLWLKKINTSNIFNKSDGNLLTIQIGFMQFLWYIYNRLNRRDYACLSPLLKQTRVDNIFEKWTEG